MTFATYEESRDDGGPVQCYLFRYGIEAAEYFAYTNHTQELVIDHGAPLGEITYEPVPAQRDSITSNGTLDKSALKLSLDVGTELAELLRVYPPSNVVTLTIFEGHIDDPDGEFNAIWAGRVIAAMREYGELMMSAEPISTQMRRPGLRRHYQYGCGHALYQGEVGKPGCHASKAAATVTATVDSIDGTKVTLDAGWEGAFPAAKFLRGTLEWTPAGASTEKRMIIRVAGNVLWLSGIPKGLAASDSVDVVLGCNHKAYAEVGGDCQPLHNNILDYGGCLWIPIKNVINANPYY